MHIRAQGLGEVYVGETGWDLTRPGESRDTVLAGDVAVVRIGGFAKGESYSLFTLIPAGRNPNAIADKAFRITESAKSKVH